MLFQHRPMRIRGLVTLLVAFLVGITVAITSCSSSSSSSPVAMDPTPAPTVAPTQAPTPEPIVVTTVMTVMSGGEVVPPVAVGSTATATATLTGSNLVVTGEFSDLEGTLRDFTVDPVDDPNLNARLTSAVHIHMGPFGENGPFQFPLTVTTSDGLSGTFVGDFMLSDAQVEAFTTDRLYYDIHTAANRPGELRGQIMVP